MRRDGPPRAADRLARALLPRDQAERLLVDLHEEYEDFQRPSRPRLAADAWYWRQVLGSVRALRSRRRRAASTPGRAASVGTTLHGLLRGVRHAARRLRRNPTHTVSSTLTLALGIGATTALFSVVHAVLLRPLTYDEPERIVRAWENTRDGDVTEFTFRVADYRELTTRKDVFEAVGAEFPISATVSFDGQEPVRVQGRMVTPEFFRVFGTGPALGRMFTPEEALPGDRLLIVVAHGFWTRQLGADPDAVGSVLDVDGNAYTVLGVLPEDYRHVSGQDAQLFIPYTIGTSAWTAHWLHVYARLQPAVSHERATREIDAVLTELGEGERWYATVEGLQEMLVGDVSPILWALFAATGIVLAVACVNVAALTLARSSSRLGEVSLRRSLGASRGHLLGESLAEDAALAVSGGALGVALAWAFLEVLIRLSPPSIPRVADTRLDAVVLAFSIAVTGLAVLAFGLAPALAGTSGSQATPSLRPRRRETASRASQRLLGGLVVAQVAMSLALLTTAGLTVRSLRYLVEEDLGFESANALTFRVAVPRSLYGTAAEVDAFYTRLREGLGGLSGVTAVGASTDLPVSGEGAVAIVTSEARLRGGAEDGVTALQRRATADLFRALGTPLLAGREFDARDRADGEAVAIVSASLARALFGGPEEAVGQRVGWGRSPGDGDWMRVVGVVADVRYENVERAPDPQIYQAHVQSTTREMAIVVRSAGDPLALIEPAKAVLRTLDPRIPTYSVETLADLVARALAGRRFTMVLFALFGLVALGLTVAGVYGMLVFTVARRRREIGLRIAVGASGASVVRTMLTRSARVFGSALPLGALGAYLGGRLMSGFLVGVPRFDPASFAVAGALLAGTALAACLAPALAAARVDPVGALRAE